MRPQFTVISAIYNVAEYIGEFLASLDRQTYGIENLEVILVDDGSTDGSGEVAERWASTSKAAVRVLHQENAGQGAARNAGLDIATGEWVGFCDPDDVLSDTYFERIGRFLAAGHAPCDVLATRLLTFSTDPAQHANRHPLRGNFGGGDQVVDLGRFPTRIHLHGPTGLLRLDRLREHDLRYDTRIRPSFEDGHLVAAYLLESARPMIGFIPSAEYYYRTRADSSSSVQIAMGHESKYTDVLEHGHLDLVHRALSRHGAVPLWLQNTLVYDLFWYLRADNRTHSLTGSIPARVLDRFHELTREILAHVDVETVLAFNIVSTPLWMKQALLGGYKDEAIRPSYIWLDRVDRRQRLVRARYYFTGDLPDEEFLWRGLAVEPTYAKVRGIDILGRRLLCERIAWLPLQGTIRISLDGRPVPLSTKLQPQLPYTISAGRLVKDLGGAPARRDKGGIRRRGRRMAGQLKTSAHRAVDQVSGLASKDKREQARANLTRSVAGSAWAKRRYADAWVLMDRIDQAQDNAEHLYRYLKRKRPGVNAWFVLDRQSADWDRLAAEGFKLVPYGSLEWRALLLNARHVLSSHTSAFASDPLPRKLYGAPTWRFTFLQHGVTKDDLSRWLNPKRFDIIVAATVDEAASFTGDGSPYMFTDKEVRLTGFPRHDALLHLARSLSPDQVDRLLVMPTWRHALTNSLPEALDAEERYAVFRESEYAEQWLGLLNSPALKALADEGGLRITLLPHPNMAAYLRATDVPDWVDVLRWADVNVQDVFARSKLLVTDYTSVAFDIALLDRPVAYFQFDRDAFFSGAQPFRKGYFDYDRDAFGPIAFTQEELMAALHKLAVDDFAPSPEVAERIARAFGERRGDACYQVFKAVSRLDTAVPARVLEGAAVAVASSPGTDVGVPQEAGPGEPLVEVGLPGEVLAFEASTEALIAADVTSEADAVAEAPTPMGPDADPVVVGDEEI